MNEEKVRLSETSRAIEASKREMFMALESERNRFSSFIAESKEAVLMVGNERVEKAKEELLARIREAERVNNSQT